MKRMWRPFLPAGAFLLALGMPGRADIALYEGQTPQASGLKLLPWGSGEATDSTEYVFTGIKSIKVKTHGRYQGARLVLERPLDLRQVAASPASQLAVTVLVPERMSTGRLGGSRLGPGGTMGPGGMIGPGGAAGSGGMMGPGGMAGPGGLRGGRGGSMTGPPGMGGSGGMTGPPGMGGSGGTTSPGGSRSQRGGRGGSGGMLGPGGPGGDGTGGGMLGPGGSGRGTTYGQDLLVEPKPIKSVRVVVVLNTGKQVDVTLPLEYTRPNPEGWRTLSFPIAAIPALKGAEGQITEVRIFGDSVGTMYVGAIRAVDDQTPIRVANLPERTVAVNDKVTFTASAEAGVSQLKYEWTVLKAGEKVDQLPVDAEGRVFEHKFRKSGEYDVHLTVRDVYGLKAPAHTVTRVRVTM